MGRTVTTYATRSGISMLEQRSQQIRNANIRIDFLNKIVWLIIPIVLKYTNQQQVYMILIMLNTRVALLKNTKAGVSSLNLHEYGMADVSTASIFFSRHTILGLSYFSYFNRNQVWSHILFNFIL